MAAAKKCDRCGKLYTNDEYKENATNYMWIRRCPDFCNTSSATYDLCPECGKALDEWLEKEDA